MAQIINVMNKKDTSKRTIFWNRKIRTLFIY